MSNKRYGRAVLLILMLGAAGAIGSGCDRGMSRSGNDPTQRLNDYISQSFSVKSVQDRAQLLDYLTGDAKTRLAAWSDEQFQQAFIDSHRQFVKLAFKEVKPLSAQHVDITYELTYLTQGADPKATGAKITNKKLAEMIQEQGKWEIGEVRNIKELVEYSNEMSLP